MLVNILLLFVASSISGVPLEKVARASLPYLLVLIVDLIVMTIFPGIVIF